MDGLEEKSPKSAASQTIESPLIESPSNGPQPDIKDLNPKDKQSRNRWLIWLTAVFLALGCAWLLYWLFFLRFDEYTDDAYVNGNRLPINSVVASSVTAFYADNTSFVSEGQLLVQLDDTNYRLVLEKELQALACTVLQVQQLYDSVKGAEALVAAKTVSAAKAEYDSQNRARLIGSKAISNEEYSHAQDALKIAQAELLQAESQLKTTLDLIGTGPLDKHPQIEKQKSIVREAFYQLTHCSIYAPYSGYVAQRSVEVGSWVTPSHCLMAIIPTDYVWVDANFKETQLTYMRVGQPATISFDIYGPDVEFTGTVLGIASGTGSVFSIIPPQNATGNWIKIVQRLPVRISLPKEMVEKYPLRLGLSAEVNVDITNQDLPYLAGKACGQPISSTTVYQINFKAIEATMDSIITDHMSKEDIH